MDMKRVFLKLSGEALAGPKKTGFDEDTVKEVARQVKISVDAGVQVGIVIGGGNFWRGRTSDAIERTKADQIGMLATIMNCIYVSEIFRNAGMKTEVLTPFVCGAVTELFSKDKANRQSCILCRRHRTSVFLYRYRYYPACSGDGRRLHSACKIHRRCV